MASLTLRRLSLATLVATLGVILWGAYVRATGSGAGCGSHWPLCNGVVVPHAPTVKTLIELTHRLTSGAALILTLLTLVVAMRQHDRGHSVRTAAGFSMFFMLTEAGVGAGLVLFEMVAENKSLARAYWMSAHLVNTYFLVGAMALTVAFAHGLPSPRRGPRTQVVAALATGMLAVGTSGAMVALGDTLFPARSLVEGMRADLTPGAHLLLRLRVVHPILALVVGACVVLFARNELVRGRAGHATRWAKVVLFAFTLQIAVGFLNLGLLAPIPLQIIHLLGADVLWISCVLFGASLLAEQPEPQSCAVPSSAL